MSRRRRRKHFALLTIAVAALMLASSATAAKRSKQKSRRVTAEEQLAFGVDMAKRGLWREALFRFQRARQLEPSQPRVLNNLAVAYEAVGEFESALEHYKMALQADPGNRDLKKNYARFVEFYQSFKPPEQEEADAAPETEAETEGGQTQSAAA